MRGGDGPDANADIQDAGAPWQREDGIEVKFENLRARLDERGEPQDRFFESGNVGNAAPRRRATMACASHARKGGKPNWLSAKSSASVPPEATATTGPNMGSWMAPSSISTGTKPNISTAAPNSRIVRLPARTVVRRNSDSVRSENTFAPCILANGRANAASPGP